MTPGNQRPAPTAFFARRWQACILLAPALVFYALLWRTYTPSPFLDDFDYIFPFAVNYTHAASAAQKLALIVNTQVGTYKAVLSFSAVALQLRLLGHLNFTLLALTGDLAILGIFAVLVCGMRNEERSAAGDFWYLLPVGLFLFTLNYAELMNWAMTALAPQSVILFSLLSIYLLVYRERSWQRVLLATLAGCVGSAAVLNGLFVWPLGIVFLFRRERRPLYWALWLSGFALSAFLYFVHLKKQGFKASSALFAKLEFFAWFCGSAIENMHHRPLPYISLAIGLFVIAVCVHACVTRFDRRSPFLFYAMLWVMLTAVSIVIGRTSMGVNVSLSSRYKMYCDLLLIFCYGYLFNRAEQVTENGARMRALRRVVQWGIAASAVVFIAGNVGGYRFLQKRRANADGAMLQYLDSNGALSPRFKQGDPPGQNEYDDAETARRLMNESVRLGIYQPKRP